MPSASKERVVRQFQLSQPKSVECGNAAVILERAHDSANALLRAYELARAQRGKPRGISTDDEQDLLRAMLVLAAAGLDAMLKQLIRDAIPALVTKDQRVREAFEKFVARSIRGEAANPELVGGVTFLAKVLSAPSYQQAVVDQYTNNLTGGSLQSPEELARTAAAFVLKNVKIDFAALKPIFDARNKIIHELDIDLDGDRRKRTHRGLEDMRKYTKTVLQLAEEIVVEVDEKLAPAGAAGT